MSFYYKYGLSEIFEIGFRKAVNGVSWGDKAPLMLRKAAFQRVKGC